MPRRMPRRTTYAAAVLATLVPLVSGVLVAPPRAAVAAVGATQHRVAVSLTAVSGRVRLNRHAGISGTVTDIVTGRPLTRMRVTLQVRSRHGWATPPGATGLTGTGGRFTMSAPTYFYGHHSFRVLVSAQTNGRDAIVVPAASPVGSVNVPVPYPAAGRAGAKRLNGSRFDPCRPIPYRINYAGAPSNARHLVTVALAKARAASGLTFVYAGSYSGVPFSGRRNNGLPAHGIGFAWATSRQVSGLASGAVGFGGGGWAVNDEQIASGVVINRTYHFRKGWTGPNSIGGLLLHELGHALGLEHVKDRRQVMYPLDVGAPSGNYNRGDISALQQIGLDGGCL